MRNLFDERLRKQQTTYETNKFIAYENRKQSFFEQSISTYQIYL